VPITFTIRAIDGEGIVPTADIVGAFPFQLTLLQTDLSNVTYNNTFLVPYTVVSQQNGVWNVTCTPTRSLNTTGDLNLLVFISPKNKIAKILENKHKLREFPTMSPLILRILGCLKNNFKMLN
jgi:hypothetical protein